MNLAADLDKMLKEICPIDGVSLGEIGDKSTWRIDFHVLASNAQRTAARVFLENFDPIAYTQANAYKEARQQAYAPLEDQLDMIWHAMDAGTLPKNNEFYVHRKEVKDLYPSSAMSEGQVEAFANLMKTLGHK